MYDIKNRRGGRFMKQLIQITTIPIAYEMQIEKAKIEHHEGTANLEISSNQAGHMQIKSQPIKLNLDTYESGNALLNGSLGIAKQGNGSPVIYQATVSMDQEGQLLLKGKISDNLNRVDATKQAVASDRQVSESPADLTIRYQMDKMNFDMKIANGNFEFIPGNINIEITQYPDVQIEYVGGPIYVPPSADPNFEGVDVRA